MAHTCGPFTPFPVLRSDRLLLRSVEEHDVKELFALRCDEETARLVGRPRAQTLDDALDFIRRIHQGMERGEWAFWALSFAEQERLIGTVCLWNIAWEQGRAELGFELIHDYRGQGLMGEAVAKVLTYGYGVLRFVTVEARVHPDNRRCRSLLARHGFTREDTGAGKSLEVLLYSRRREDAFALKSPMRC